MKNLAALLLAVTPLAGLAFEPDLPTGARQLIDEEKSRAYYELPLGPFRNGMLPTERARGLLRQQSWRLDGQAGAVTEIGEALALQLIQDGYELVFHCLTEDCGGFDFRFATHVMPPPDMFVDLSHFRFISARRDTKQGPDVVGIMLSHTTSAAMVQVISVTPMAPVQLNLTDAQTREAAEDAKLKAASVDASGGITSGSEQDEIDYAERLASDIVSKGHVVLTDLSFQTGSSRLSDGSYSSLEALAAWLLEVSDRRVALVGHTDSEGAFDKNLELSKARAISVRDHLIQSLSVPAEQLEAHGIGYLAPVASNAQITGREANRRVEAVLLVNP